MSKKLSPEALARKSERQPVSLSERLVLETVMMQRNALVAALVDVRYALDEWQGGVYTDAEALIEVRAAVESVRWPRP